MSYEKVKSMSINEKQKRISICLKSSNDTADYHTIVKQTQTKEEFDSLFNDLMFDIVDGSIQFNKSCSKWFIITAQCKQAIREKYPDDRCYEHKEEFAELFKEKMNEEHKGKYSLYINDWKEYVKVKGRVIIQSKDSILQDYYKTLLDYETLKATSYCWLNMEIKEV